ncbi:MAG: lipase [Candidatus Poribacteria bacterium]|nr:MAG: lipase [Candidatus Poribacteria bacterium]
MELILEDGQSVLFIGDSITDAGRRQDNARALGFGYVAYIADFLAARYPERSIRILNRGIGGDRVLELQRRWTEDVIAHRPDWVSISIGINDVWRLVAGIPEAHVPLDQYKTVYRELLEQTQQETEARLILMETSVIGEDPDNEANGILKDYNAAIREFAEEFGAVLVPIFTAFCRAIRSRPGFAWTSDGVHPLPPGHMLMATTWLEAVGALPPR